MFAQYLTLMAYWLERTIDKMSLQQYIPSQLAEKKTLWIVCYSWNASFEGIELKIMPTYMYLCMLGCVCGIPHLTLIHEVFWKICFLKEILVGAAIYLPCKCFGHEVGNCFLCQSSIPCLFIPNGGKNNYFLKQETIKVPAIAG